MKRKRSKQQQQLQQHQIIRRCHFHRKSHEWHTHTHIYACSFCCCCHRYFDSHLCFSIFLFILLLFVRTFISLIVCMYIVYYFSFASFKVHNSWVKQQFCIRLDGRVLVYFRIVCVLCSIIRCDALQQICLFDNVIALTLAVANLLVKSLLLWSLATRVDYSSLSDLNILSEEIQSEIVSLNLFDLYSTNSVTEKIMNRIQNWDYQAVRCFLNIFDTIYCFVSFRSHCMYLSGISVRCCTLYIIWNVCTTT